MDITGVVCCGGSALRMGSDKALLEFDGTPLWSHVAGRLKSLCSPILLARGTMPPLDQSTYPVVVDAAPDKGPLGAILAGLQASPHEMTAVVGVDMPWVDVRLLRHLADRLGSCDVSIPLWEGRPQPLHAVYSISCRPHLKTALADGRLSVTDLLTDLDVALIDPSDFPAGTDLRFGENLNHPEDVERLMGRTIRF